MKERSMEYSTSSSRTVTYGFLNPYMVTLTGNSTADVQRYIKARLDSGDADIFFLPFIIE